jgi:flagellar FliJ protein
VKKFKFSMAQLQNYKEQVLESEKNTLGILRKELRELGLQREQLLQLIELKSNELEYIMISGVTPADLAMRKLFITAKQQETHETEHRISLKEDEVEKQLNVVIEATKDVNTLEKLEERQLEDYKYAQMKEEELFIEEFVSNQRQRVQETA